MLSPPPCLFLPGLLEERFDGHKTEGGEGEQAPFASPDFRRRRRRSRSETREVFGFMHCHSRAPLNYYHLWDQVKPPEWYFGMTQGVLASGIRLAGCFLRFWRFLHLGGVCCTYSYYYTLLTLPDDSEAEQTCLPRMLLPPPLLPPPVSQMRKVFIFEIY